MERDILSQVIEAEKEIQHCLDLEKVKVQEWLEREKKACDEEFNREEAIIKASLAQAASRAVKEAETKAAGIMKEAANASDRLGRLEVEVLSTIIVKQIDRILPG